MDKPKIPLSKCWELFEELVQARLVDKSKEQIRKWKNVRRRAFDNFINVAKAEYLHEVTRSEILAFWNHLNERIKDGYKANSANKQLTSVKDVLRTVSVQNEIDLDMLFAETFFKDTSDSCPPFEASYVQNVLLPATGVLSDRDKYGFWAIGETGMRQSELFRLTPDDIFLDEEIPFVWARQRKGYSLKTLESKRKIPLIGGALAAFKKFPNGFSHLSNAESFSAAVNNFLTANKLRPTVTHSAYSLRHTFKDRLLDYGDVAAPVEIIDELMGHKKPGVNYVRGHKLETKHKILSEIAYSVTKIEV